MYSDTNGNEIINSIYQFINNEIINNNNKISTNNIKLIYVKLYNFCHTNKLFDRYDSKKNLIIKLYINKCLMNIMNIYNKNIKICDMCVHFFNISCLKYISLQFPFRDYISNYTNIYNIQRDCDQFELSFKQSFIGMQLLLKDSNDIINYFELYKLFNRHETSILELYSLLLMEIIQKDLNMYLTRFDYNNDLSYLKLINKDDILNIDLNNIDHKENIHIHASGKIFILFNYIRNNPNIIEKTLLDIL